MALMHKYGANANDIENIASSNVNAKKSVGAKNWKIFFESYNYFHSSMEEAYPVLWNVNQYFEVMAVVNSEKSNAEQQNQSLYDQMDCTNYITCKCSFWIGAGMSLNLNKPPVSSVMQHKKDFSVINFILLLCGTPTKKIIWNEFRFVYIDERGRLIFAFGAEN